MTIACHGSFCAFQQVLRSLQPRPLVWLLVFVSCLSLVLPLESSAEDPPGTHNMLVIGEKTMFLSHLPMFGELNASTNQFDSVHRYQAILQATLTKTGESVYVSDRENHPKMKMYTLSPEDFILPRLVKGDSRSTLSAFQGTIFRGHLERGGEKIRELQDIRVQVTRVILFQELHPDSRKLLRLEYILFGKGDELFLAHRITKPPDFDQILSVQIPKGTFSDAELATGVSITVPERGNSAAQRVLTSQEVRATFATADEKRVTTIRCLEEIYFEEGELFSPPTFRRTDLEKKADF
jgi:hypothetical protein